jgi:hypothetical protein
MKLPVDERRQRFEDDAKRLESYYRDAVARGEMDVADAT